MGIVSRLLFGEEKDPKMIWTMQPLKIIYALETFTHIINQNREDKFSRDEVITHALNSYLKKNLWATPEETANHTTIKRGNFDELGTGRMQRKK